MRSWTRTPSTAPAPRASGEDRAVPGKAAPRRGLPGAPDFSVDGGESVFPGQTGSFPGWQEGQAAVGLLCDRDGCRWKCSPTTRRTPCVTDHHAAGALLLCEAGAGGRPGDRGPRRGEACGPGLDQRLEGTGHPRPCGGRRCRDVALRRERPGGDHQRCVSRRTPLPQPPAGRGPGPQAPGTA